MIDIEEIERQRVAIIAEAEASVSLPCDTIRNGRILKADALRHEAVKKAEGQMLLDLLCETVKGDNVDDVLIMLEKYREKIALDGIGINNASPLQLSVELDKLVQGCKGCRAFEILMDAGADPRAANRGGLSGTIVTYLDWVLTEIDKPAVVNSLRLKIRGRFAEVREAVCFIAERISKERPFWAAPVDLYRSATGHYNPTVLFSDFTAKRPSRAQESQRPRAGASIITFDPLHRPRP